jgi:tRNA (guanine-N7-)-methyltransferase
MADAALSTYTFLDAPSGPLLPWRRLRFPLAWDEHFPVSGPLHLEVGFGDGRYTVRRAQGAPNERFVGLEISSASLQRGLNNVRKRGLRNVKLLKVGAGFAVQHLFAPHSLESITVNFPDPWPKERHEKHRLLQAAFFKLAASRLGPGGAVLLATDHPDYLAFARAESRKSGLFTLETAEPPAAVFETKYALKWKTMGKPLFYQVFRYGGAATPEYPTLEREATMPHALLSGQLPPQVPFSKQVTPYAGGHVILHEVARSLGADDGEGGEKWFVRATVEEPELRQQVLVSVRSRGGAGLIVGLEPFGDPVVTPVTRGAVHAVTEWLLTLPADLKVETRSY